MHRTIKLAISASKSDLNRLHQCNMESAHVWNKCLSTWRRRYEEAGEWSTKYELQKEVKYIKTNVICASSKQIVAHKVCDAFYAIKKSKESGRDDVVYPYKTKKYYVTEWTYQFMKVGYDANSILLSVAQYTDNEGRRKKGKPILLRFKYPLPHNIKTLKLIFENGRYYACISYLVNNLVQTMVGGNCSGVDLGEIHSITSVDSNSNQIIITGRKLRSIKQFRNKKQAELLSKMDRCKKGSRQWHKYRMALKHIGDKTIRQLHYSIHKLTRMYTDWAVEKGISVVYCGDVTDLDRGMKLKRNGNANVRQKLSQ